MSTTCTRVIGTSSSDNYDVLCGKPAEVLWDGQAICKDCLAGIEAWNKQRIARTQKDIDRLESELVGYKKEIAQLKKAQKK